MHLNKDSDFSGMEEENLIGKGVEEPVGLYIACEVTKSWTWLSNWAPTHRVLHCISLSWIERYTCMLALLMCCMSMLYYTFNYI